MCIRDSHESLKLQVEQSQQETQTVQDELEALTLVHQEVTHNLQQSLDQQVAVLESCHQQVIRETELRQDSKEALTTCTDQQETWRLAIQDRQRILCQEECVYTMFGLCFLVYCACCSFSHTLLYNSILFLV